MSVLEKIDVDDFLAALGIEVESQSGDNALFCCPFHRDRHPSARMNVKTTAWLCSVGCGKGNAIHFLAQLREMSFDEARDHIYSRYGIGPGAPIDDLESEVRRNLERGDVIIPERVAPDESWVDYLAIDWEVEEHPAQQYMIGRGFSPAICQQWQLGFDELSQRVTIPVRDHHFNLVGFKGRAIDPEREPRYLVIGDNNPEWRPYGFETYRKSEVVFAMHMAISSLWNPNLDRVVLVEGELNAIAMWDRHQVSAVAVAGSEFSETHRRLIAEHFDKVTIYFDDDVYEKDGSGRLRDRNPGRLGAAKVASALLPFLDVDVVLGAPDDAAALDSAQVLELLANAQPAMQLAVCGEMQLALTT
jgi:DNA primase